jgi:hypothetical protein
MKKIMFIALILIGGCMESNQPLPESPDYPKIASWLSQKDRLLESGKPYDLIMTGWVTPEEAERFKEMNPRVIILAGLTVNWIYDDPGWKTLLETLASADGTQRTIREDMVLKNQQGTCAFGWASDEWGHQEIYAMDPRNEAWRELVLAAYKTILEQPQHDGVIVDMLLDVSWCPEIISTEEWVAGIQGILADITSMAHAQDKLVIFNAGREFSDIDSYAPYMDGYLMENFLGAWGADYLTGLEAAEDDFLLIYAVDTDDTGDVDEKRMRLGLTLSLLNDHTYITYDFGPRDHGQAWWFPEYDVQLGAPLGPYYEKNRAYWRKFENGMVISSPFADLTITFDISYTDVTTGITSTHFTIKRGDGRIFLKNDT